MCSCKKFEVKYWWINLQSKPQKTSLDFRDPRVYLAEVQVNQATVGVGPVGWKASSQWRGVGSQVEICFSLSDAELKTSHVFSTFWRDETAWFHPCAFASSLEMLGVEHLSRKVLALRHVETEGIVLDSKINRANYTVVCPNYLVSP